MTNLIILLLVWCTGIVLCYAWALATFLRRAFREEVVTEAAGEHQAVPAGDTRILSYAKPPTTLSLRRRWPIISAVLALPVLPVMALPVVPLIVVAFVGFAQESGILCAEALGVTLFAVIAVAYWGLREAGGQPAAVSWRRLGLAIICWAGIFAAVWSVLAWRSQRMLDAQLAKADALGRQLEIRSADGASAAAVYRQAGIGPPKQLEYEVDWEFMTVDGQVSPPPAFPAAHEFRVPLLRQATAMPASGLTPPASEYWLGTPLPHLAAMRMAANLLRQHAINEARAGRVDSAIADVNAIHGLATHAAQGLTIVECLVACGIHNIGFDTLQHVLPFVQDPHALDLIRTPSPDECFAIIRRAAHAEYGVADRRTLAHWLRADVPYGTIASVPGSGPQSAASPELMFLYRTALCETETRTLDDVAGLFPDIIPESPAAAASSAPAIDVRVMSMRGRSMLAGMMIWRIGRTIDHYVQTAAMAELSRAAVATTRFRLQQNRLPSSFEELVQAGLLPAVPIDPFSRQPMCFAAHEGYVFIFTLGPNRLSSGGMPYGLGRGGTVVETNPGFILSPRPLWELDLLPAGFVPAAKPADDE